MKIFVTVIFCSLSLLCFGQNNAQTPIKIDNRLYDVYSADYLDRLQETNPFLLQRWNFYLDNAFFITDKPKGKDLEYRKVVVNDLENINILLLEKEQKLQHDFHKRTYYEIDGTDKILVFYQGKKFKDALNEYLGRQ